MAAQAWLCTDKHCTAVMFEAGIFVSATPDCNISAVRVFVACLRGRMERLTSADGCAFASNRELLMLPALVAVTSCISECVGVLS